MEVTETYRSPLEGQNLGNSKASYIFEQPEPINGGGGASRKYDITILDNLMKIFDIF